MYAFDPTLARCLRWILAVPQSGEKLKLTFAGLRAKSDAGSAQAVTDYNKEEFVQRVVDLVLVESRREVLAAVRDGFFAGVADASGDAAAVVRAMAAVELQLMLVGDDVVSTEQLLACTHFVGFPIGSLVPQWFKAAAATWTPDELSRFLIRVLDAPVLPDAKVRRDETGFLVVLLSSLLTTCSACSSYPFTVGACLCGCESMASWRP